MTLSPFSISVAALKTFAKNDLCTLRVSYSIIGAEICQVEAEFFTDIVNSKTKKVWFYPFLTSVVHLEKSGQRGALENDLFPPQFRFSPGFLVIHDRFQKEGRNRFFRIAIHKIYAKFQHLNRKTHLKTLTRRTLTALGDYMRKIQNKLFA